MSSRNGVSGVERWAPGAWSALDDREDVLLADDEELLAVEFEFGPRVLRVEDLVAGLDVDRFALAVIERLPRSDGDDLALLGLLLGGVRQDDAALGHVLARDGLDDDAVTEWAQLGRGRDRSGFGQRAVPPVTARAGRQAWLVGVATGRNGARSASPSIIRRTGSDPPWPSPAESCSRPMPRGSPVR